MNIILFHCAIIFLLFIQGIFAGSQITTYLTPHTPSMNLARQRMGLEMLTNYIDEDDHRPIFQLTGWATESFREKQIARCYFGCDYNDCTQQLIIAGSQTDGRKRINWLADYFGLPTDYISAVNFEPVMVNVLLEPYVFWQFAPHFYLTAFVPFGYTSWDMKAHECIIKKGINPYAPGYFSDQEVPRDDLLQCFLQFMNGQTPIIENIEFQPLQNARISKCSLTKSGMTECVFTLAWRAVERESLIFDIYVRGAIPGGNRPEGYFLFEPILGNGHHGELGAGFAFSCMMWERPECEERVFFSFEFAATHLFTTKQRRSFDLCNKPNSRYMLAERMGTPIDQNLVGFVHGENVTPNAQFKHEFAPIANLTTGNVNVSIPAQTDLCFLITYEKQQMYFTFGYGFWRRSQEHIELCTDQFDDTFCLEPHTWAIKGDAHIIGFEIGNDNPVALSATQSRATIHAGRNTPTKGETDPAEIARAAQNPFIDNPAAALADSENSGIHHPLVTAPGGVDQINTSVEPIFIRRRDIDPLSAASHGSAHQLVGQFGYTWYERCHTPFIGFGAEVELGHGGQSTAARENECINASLSFWSIWLKGGFAIG